jgi:hypothetical protein
MIFFYSWLKNLEIPSSMIGSLIGIEEAEFQEFKSVALIKCGHPEVKSFIATLIKNQWIVTTFQNSIQCMKDGADSVKVILGEYQSLETEGTESVFGIEKVSFVCLVTISQL